MRQGKRGWWPIALLVDRGEIVGDLIHGLLHRKPPLRPDVTAQQVDHEYIRITPGPVEQTLRDLEVVDPAALSRAAAIDQAAEQLILRHAHRVTTPRRPQTETAFGRSTATAQLANHLLASGGPQAAAIIARSSFANEPGVEPEVEP